MEKILSSVGVEADKEKLKLVVAACKGKTLEQLMAEGTPKLAAMGRYYCRNYAGYFGLLG